MIPSAKKYVLHYSLIISRLPVIGFLVYSIEFFFIRNGLLKHIWLSHRDTCERGKLIKQLTHFSNTIICTSPKFGRMLRLFRGTVVFDYTTNRLPSTSAELHDLTWSLVHSSHVTYKTARSLKSFIPSSIMIRHTVIIPYHESFSVAADFVLQTANSLNRLQNEVHIITFKYTFWILSWYFHKIFRKKSDLPEVEQGIKVIPFLTLFPKFVSTLGWARKLNQQFANYLIYRFVCSHPYSIIWCFDHEDLELVIRTKDNAVTLYDCVDNFTSVYPIAEKYIYTRESKLISLVDHFFVNSKILKKRKRSIREDGIVVPQGFDLESFSHSLPESAQSRISRIFEPIPLPRIGYIGNLTYRFDFTLLSKLISQLPQVSFVFVGKYLAFPYEDRILRTLQQLSDLKKFPNVFILPHYSRQEIKEIITYFDVCVIPNDISLDFNKYCYPMKLFEYFYAGKPVIATPILELKHFPKHVFIGKNPSEWNSHISSLLSQPWPETYKKAQRELAKANSWDMKTQQILSTLNQGIYTTNIQGSTGD